jgi:hypothetical protein
LAVQNIKKPIYDVYNAYLCIHLKHLEETLLNLDVMDPKDKAGLRTDALQMLTNLVKGADDEEINLLVNQEHL